jgi:hypothetical protein
LVTVGTVLSVPMDKSANVGLKLASLVVGMAATDRYVETRRRVSEWPPPGIARPSTTP